MANLNSPFGLRPKRDRNNKPWAGGITKRSIANAFATSIFRGDLVVYATTGFVTRFAAGGAFANGIFLGCNYLSATTGKREWSSYYPASVAATGDIECDIMDDPTVLSEIQIDSTAALTIAIIGANADITATAGSTANGQSAEVLAGAGIAVTATLPLRIHSFMDDPLNEPASAFARVLVTLNTQGQNVALGI